MQHAAVSVANLFVGEGWHLTLGLLFMAVVIFLPGGIMEGIMRLLNLKHSPVSKSLAGSPQRDVLGEGDIEDMTPAEREAAARNRPTASDRPVPAK